MPDTTPEPYDGREVLLTTVKVVRAGDGLSESLATDMRTLHMGQEVDVLLRCRVVQHNIKPYDKDNLDGPLQVAFVLAAGKRATFPEADDVQHLFDAQQKRADAAKGTPQLPMDKGEPEKVGTTLAGILGDAKAQRLADDDILDDDPMWDDDEPDGPPEDDPELEPVDPEVDQQGPTPGETWDDAVRRHGLGTEAP
jgi:hypothetical protein